MRTIIGNGRLVLPSGIVPGGVLVEDGHIAEVFDAAPMPRPGDRAIDAGGCYISPGFIDTHIHGGGGADVMDASVEAVQHIAQVHARHGLTAFLPTTLTAPGPDIARACDAVRQAMQAESPGAEVLGIHLEGPFVSMRYKGAQNPAYLMEPSVENYMQITGGGAEIRRVSMAPELPGAFALARWLKDRGVLVSAAHTDADYAVMREALAHGFSHVTHCYNGMSGIQSPDFYCRAGVIESTLELDGYMAEVICDGRHIPPELIRLLIKCKAPGMVSLTSDATRPTCMPEGQYDLGGLPVLVEDGVAMLADKTSFAGSVATADRLVRNAVHNVGLPLHEAVAMVSRVPASSLGLQQERGTLQAGQIADVLLFDEDIHIQLVMLQGDVLAL